MATSFWSGLLMRRKLACMLAPSVLALCAFGGYLVLKVGDDLAMARSELAGIEPMRQIQSTIRLTQQHRGLSAAWLAGNEQAGQQRQAKEGEVEQALLALQRWARATPERQHLDRDWTQAVELWQDTVKGVREKQFDARKAIARHTRLIQDQLNVLDQVLFDSKLILDPTAEGYSLVTLAGQFVPLQSERLGQLRARGSAALAAHTLAPTDHAAILALIGQVDASARQTDSALKHIEIAQAALAATLKPQAEAARQSMEMLIALIKEQVLNADDLRYDASRFYAEATKAIEAQFALRDTSTQLLEDQLKQRVQHARLQLIAAAAVLLVVTVLSVLVAFSVARQIVRGLNHAVKVSEGLAQGHLAVPITVEGRDEIAQLLTSMARTQDELRAIVSEVRVGVDHVSATSQQLGQGNANLEARTQQQSDNVARTSAAMREMTESVRANADNAANADRLASEANAMAERGGAVVQQVVSTMENIRTSSARIADIIGTIDGIAFQTNILALNAAVEAARAGEQGRGFAVVAGEVRSLAQRSAHAAQEIKQLIAESVERVETGNAAVHEAGQTIAGMVDQVRQVAILIGQITLASREQQAGIEDVSNALEQLDDGTRQNTSLVEQSASAARSLQDQAQRLLVQVEQFQLDAR